MADNDSLGARTPLLEWVAAAIGLLLTLAIFGVLAREAMTGEPDEVPVIEVAMKRVTPAGSGFVVEFEARNISRGSAAAVVVEGALNKGNGAGQTSSATIDYIPGNGTAEGGLYFSSDPRSGSVALRALGYQTP
ncbi:hypothetical protein TPR58_11640 [Sphingomonas sp. HF-S3]|uniref:TIGR02588 family protein n=1 Tax=Sphingomonas rustica TaxID=3103142 RepID=A0ABV0BB71_9SPHN